ncbi:MAG: TraB/GumN family protein [Clostridiales Family XIII bacterium]|nr:TraB/GumN family protein [Clostridiales Family XIII bacterium]
MLSGRENVTRIDCGGKEIILLATAHVSKQSVELVKRAIEEERPDSVCVELDEDRYRNIQDPEAWKRTDITKVIRSKKVGFLLANLILSSYQRKMAEKLQTKVGQEMIQGVESAKEAGAELVLADRKIQITFLRIWRKLGIVEKMKLIYSLVFSFDDGEDITDADLQAMLKDDMLEAAMGDIHRQFPKISGILIGERDQYLANMIKNAPGRKVVAVLGGAHVPGVKSELFKEQDMAAISEVPPASPIGRVLPWLLPAALVALIAYAFFQSASVGFEQIRTWLVWTSALAAIFTALALGHPLTVLTSLVVAPFTAIHPLLACGWFSGLVEAYIRRPTVDDIETVPEVILSLKGFFRNRFLRIILIVIMANTGTMIGNIVAGLDIIKSVF